MGDGTGDSGSGGQIVCDLPPGMSTGRSVEILIKWQGIELSVPAFKYRSPQIYSILPSIFPVAGGQALTIYGDNFSPGDFWVSSTPSNAVRVEFIAPSGLTSFQIFPLIFLFFFLVRLGDGLPRYEVRVLIRAALHFASAA